MLPALPIVIIALLNSLQFTEAIELMGSNPIKCNQPDGTVLDPSKFVGKIPESVSACVKCRCVNSTINCNYNNDDCTKNPPTILNRKYDQPPTTPSPTTKRKLMTRVTLNPTPIYHTTPVEVFDYPNSDEDDLATTQSTTSTTTSEPFETEESVTTSEEAEEQTSEETQSPFIDDDIPNTTTTTTTTTTTKAPQTFKPIKKWTLKPYATKVSSTTKRPTITKIVPDLYAEAVEESPDLNIEERLQQISPQWATSISTRFKDYAKDTNNAIFLLAFAIILCTCIFVIFSISYCAWEIIRNRRQPEITGADRFPKSYGFDV